ncbi:hypothetical protein MLD38_039581 [Melastoma candidum]|uniref:Uncharacterized protein n=1 Tax=Melastoma candidum TaxID=119954 RepID=A0ACB9L3S0_9MYRT|nr:hypothetical protein MLD38_039581 [Melastoma candidum]
MMKPKANLDDGKEDPVTELGLSLGYSTVCSRKAVSNSPSAGANAGSLSFVAANPVSELVWSPQGLTLKYADCSFMERQSSRFLGVGPSNMVMPTSHAEKLDPKNIVSTKGDIASPEGNCPANEANSTKDASDVGDSRNRDRSSNHDAFNPVEKLSRPAESTSLAFPGREVGRTIEMLQNEPDPADCGSHDKASGCGRKKQVIGIASSTAISPVDVDNVVDGGTLSRLVENDQVGNPCFPLSEKLESMDENDIREPDSQIAGGAEMKFAASESEVKIKSIHGMKDQLEMLIPLPPSNHSPEISRGLENHSADNRRASFDTDADGRLLKEKSDSTDSVESCNRAMVTKKRWLCDQPLFIGSKRAKQIHDHPSSSNFSGQNSSFMNWISNMMKGLSRPTIDAGAPLSFAFADPSDSPKDVACALTSEQNVRHTGFRSFFQRIYQPNEDAREIGLPITANEARMGSSSTGGINEVRTICADQIQRQKGADDVSKWLVLSNNEFHEDTPVVASGPSSLPLGTHGHMSICKGVSGAYSVEDKVLVNKKTTPSSSPLEQEKLKADSAEDKTPQFGCKGDFGSLWMNRFSSKASGSLLKMDGAGGATDDCHNSVRTLVQSPKSGGSEKNGNLDDYHNERPLGAAGNELPACHAGVTESSDAFTKAASCSEENNVREIDVMLPSKCLKSSEEMASTFAQRLDALKRNIPPRENGDAKPNVLCLFCGMMSHQISVCTKVAKSDLKNLLTVGHPHEPPNMSPACVKCFQSNHWAVSCPLNQVQDIKPDGFDVWIRHGFSDATRVRYGQTVLKNCNGKGDGNPKWRAVSASGTLTRAREDEELSTATNQKDQTEITTGCDSVLVKASEMPKGIFDMIRNLHLSRTDILKWTNSGTSLIHLEGYFLRLRLGKWGDKLGGSGYRVACISGMTQIDRSPVDGKIFLPVYVGGVKCLVGSQYISNHNFLEDELKEWWHATLKGGGRMPSEDDLLAGEAEAGNLRQV